MDYIKQEIVKFLFFSVYGRIIGVNIINYATPDMNQNPVSKPSKLGALLRSLLFSFLIIALATYTIGLAYASRCYGPGECFGKVLILIYYIIPAATLFTAIAIFTGLIMGPKIRKITITITYVVLVVLSIVYIVLNHQDVTNIFKFPLFSY